MKTMKTMATLEFRGATTKRPFFEELRNNIQDAGQRPANALDKVTFLACVIGGWVLVAIL